MSPTGSFLSEREAFLQQNNLDKNLIKRGKAAFAGLHAQQNVSAFLNHETRRNQVVIQGDYGFNTLEQHEHFFEQVAREFHDSALLSLRIEAPGEKERNLLKESPDKINQLVREGAFPVQLRVYKSDQRSMAEVAFASGVSSIMGGPITQTAYSFERMALQDGIKHWHYIDNLIAFYEENEITINKEISLSLTGNLIPPSLQVALVVLDALIGTMNGVSNLTLTYNQGGNMVQDIAAVKAMKALFEEFKDLLLPCEGMRETVQRRVTSYTCFASWSGGFPEEPAKAQSIIAYGGVVGTLAGVDKIVTFTPPKSDAQGITDAYIAAKKCCAQSAVIAKPQSLDFQSIEAEYRRIKESAASILNAVVNLSGGEEREDVVTSVLESFQRGIIDLPFSSMKEAQGKVLPVRGADGSVRFFDTGDLPFSREMCAFHQACLHERARIEGKAPNFQMVIDDIYAAGKGQLC